MKTCKSCKFWISRSHGPYKKYHGNCRSTHWVVARPDMRSTTHQEIDIEMNELLIFGYYDPIVGQNFGCIHHEEKQ